MCQNTSLKRKKLTELLWSLRDAEVYFDNSFNRQEDLNEDVLRNIKNTAKSINDFLIESTWDEIEEENDTEK